ncbi:hypothetical protein OsJ_06698 [Oryza sativa Japonica Group]|uniref:Uncharacterized protein n=1 Tax=Oryza sativa subsp. japonica TaxID=39947 RepID=B9EZY3_ORYSJ|nr:hypothetical protein OsJ_06698 [Oryza sativa Japonica Group]
MELPKSVDLEESPETKQVEFVDLEKGQGCEMEEEEAGAKNQTLFNVISPSERKPNRIHIRRFTAEKGNNRKDWTKDMTSITVTGKVPATRHRAPTP